jgi:pyruvate/2-oxoglutarate dehydrogenase complex dihydrolipoamide dehydrogenase (E3) component
MSAARVAALRGHDVSLYEKGSELGGQLLWARKALKRGELEQCIRYLATQVRKAGVDVHLNEEMDTRKVYETNPDVVIMATGAVPYIPFIPGADKKHVHTYLDILGGKIEPGKKVLVIGGKLIGTQIAQLISSKGSSVILTEPSPAVCQDAGGRTKWLLLLNVQRDPNIDIRLETSVEKINDNSVILQSKGAVEEVKDIDMVVLCLGAASDNRLADDLKWEGKLPDILTIGDCNMPRKMTEAIYEGYVAALHI